MQLQKTLNLMQSVYDWGHREVIVAYSCGKDSVATFDLCRQVFDRVHAFFLYIHPDLDIEQNALRKAERKFGIKIAQFPNVSLIQMLRAGYFMHHAVEKIRRQIKYDDVYTVVRDRAGCAVIAQGHRMDESLQRRGMIKSSGGYDAKLQKLYPLYDWNARGVYSYLRKRNLTGLVMKTFGSDTSGISLGTNSLLWLDKYHHSDFLKLTGMFPVSRTKLRRERMRREAGMARSERSA